MDDSTGLILLALRLLLALSLYAFLGWALWTLWRDLRQQSRSIRQYNIPAITLTFSNPSMPEKLRFALAQFYVGRDPNCEAQIENETVSSRHALLSYHHSQWWIEDLSSRNGTFINGQPISTATVVTDNDLLRCGEVEFQILLGA